MKISTLVIGAKIREPKLLRGLKFLFSWHKLLLILALPLFPPISAASSVKDSRAVLGRFNPKRVAIEPEKKGNSLRNGPATPKHVQIPEKNSQQASQGLDMEKTSLWSTGWSRYLPADVFTQT